MVKEARSFYLVTLGCKVNQYESQALREAWTNLGLREAGRPEGADWLVLNSCAVTARAVADVRACVRRLHRAAPEAGLCVTGCAATPLAEELRQLPGVTVVIAQERKADLLRGLPAKETAGNEDRLPAGGAPSASAPPFPVDGALFPPFAVSGYSRSRAVLKVQDGCAQRCAYCIVPLTRQGPRSRPPEDALAEARRLAGAGFAEITVSGVNLRQYTAPDGKGGGLDFWDLLRRLNDNLRPEFAGRLRLRLSSLDPAQLGPKALETLAACDLVAPHLHLSLQSGSPEVLRRMGRGHYSPVVAQDFCAGLAAVWPRFGLGADAIAGFPGESEEDFARTRDCLRALPLTYAHIFPYSPRPGTPAAGLPGAIPRDVKKTRASELRRLAADKKTAFLRELAALPELSAVFDEYGASEAGPDAFGAMRPEKDAAATIPGKGQGRTELHGVCEYYADCLLRPSTASGTLAAPGRALSRVRPVGVRGGNLLVEPLDAPPLSDVEHSGFGRSGAERSGGEG